MATFRWAVLAETKSPYQIPRRVRPHRVKNCCRKASPPGRYPRTQVGTSLVKNALPCSSYHPPFIRHGRPRNADHRNTEINPRMRLFSCLFPPQSAPIKPAGQSGRKLQVPEESNEPRTSAADAPP